MLKKLIAGIASVSLALGMVALTAGPAAADVGVAGTLVAQTSSGNNASSWEDYGPHDDATCYKHEANSQGISSSDHGSSDGKTVTLVPYGDDWPGDHWELLVIKAGNLWNAVTIHPTAGVAYASPVNSSGNQANVSHWIVCKGTTPLTSVTATTPTWNDAVCTGENQVGQGSYTIPAKVGVRYEVNIVGDGQPAATKAAGVYYVNVGTEIEIEAFAESGYVLTGQDYWEHTFTGPTAGKCIVPTAPTADPSLCILTAPGQADSASYTIPSKTGIEYKKWDGDSWEHIDAGTYPVTTFPTTIKIKAFKTGSFIIVPGSQVEWTFEFVSPGACLTTVTPAAPSFGDGYCYVVGVAFAGSYTIPVPVAGTKYQVKFAPGDAWVDVLPNTYPLAVGDDVYIQAVALTGYTLTGTTSWSDVAGGPISEHCVAPAAPSVTPARCDGGPGTSTQASYTIPVSTGVQYQIWNGTSWVNVGAGTENVNTFPTSIQWQAVAIAPYVFAPGATTSGTLLLESPGECLKTVDAVADIDQAVCTDVSGVIQEGDYTIFATVGVFYKVALNGGSPVVTVAGNYTVPTGTLVEITAHAETGYTISGTDSWSLQIVVPQDCIRKIEGDPTFHEGCVNNTWISPNFVVVAAANIYYTWELNDVEQPDSNGALPGTISAGTHYVSAGDKVEVTAHAEPGFELNENPWYWVHTFDNPTETCEIAPPVVTCLDAVEGTITLPAIDHVKWIVNGAPAASGPIPVVLSILDTDIQAVADTGYTFSGGPTSWTIGLDQEGECGFPTLAQIETNVTHTDQICRSGVKGGSSVTVGQVGGESWFEDADYYIQPDGGVATLLTSVTTQVPPGKYTVTASPKDPDDTIADGFDDEWEFEVLAATGPCDLTTLALTGTNPIGWAGIGYYLLVTGLALIAVRTVRRRNEAKQ